LGDGGGVVGGLAGGVAALLSGVVEAGGFTGAPGAALAGGLASGGAAAGADGLAGALICDWSLVVAEVLAVEPVVAPLLAAAISIDFRSAREAWR
jgi:hypothetical protein